MWWPELTVDVVQADLQQVTRGGRRLSAALSAESVGSSINEGDEWTVVTKGVEVPPTRHGRFESVRNTVSLMKKKLTKLKYNLSMTTMHALSTFGSSHETFVSPLDFATQGGEELPNLPSGAADMNQYVELLTGVETCCVSVTSLLMDHIRDSRTSANLDQDLKDIQRDSVVVNGQLFRGAETGYQRIVNEIAKEITANVDAEEISRIALSVANRTFSGGIAFDNVIKIFMSDALDVLVVPISAEAEPLDVAIVSPCSVVVRAHTKYRIESEGKPVALVNACLLADIRMSDIKGSRASVFIESRKELIDFSIKEFK